MLLAHEARQQCLHWFNQLISYQLLGAPAACYNTFAGWQLLAGWTAGNQVTICCPQCLQMRDHALSEHKTLKDILSDIDAMTVTSPGFGDKLEILMVVRGPGCAPCNGVICELSCGASGWIGLDARTVCTVAMC
jgi:hypothetical protein